MLLKSWDDLPEFMRTEEVRPYYDVLQKHKGSLILKRVFDLLVSLVLLILISPILLIIAITIKLDSPGPALFNQERVTIYGKHFKIHKFRTMVMNADKTGSQITVGNDRRITRVGKILRGIRLDELPQVINILVGEMSFVGTRPEVPKYVDAYKREYYATLLLPAGVTSEASIRYKEEDKLLSETEDVDKTYMGEILPEKMNWNLESIKQFKFLRDILTMGRTLLAVMGKEYR